MKPNFWFWLLDACLLAWCLLSGYWTYRSETRDSRFSVGLFLVFVLVTLIGWNQFGGPISP
jgi:hypothetical protein